MHGIDRSPVVDRVIATLIPVGDSFHFYAPELRWDVASGLWIGIEHGVMPGSYAVSIDAMVEDVWILAPKEEEIEVVASSITSISFRLDETIRHGKRQFSASRLFPGRPPGPQRPVSNEAHHRANELGTRRELPAPPPSGLHPATCEEGLKAFGISGTGLERTALGDTLPGL